MRDFIVRALLSALRILIPRRRPGRHSADHFTATALPTPVIPESPWSRPWSSPSKAEAAEILRHRALAQAEAEAAWWQEERRRQSERLYAAELASMGIDYPYSYPGAPFTEFPTGA